MAKKGGERKRDSEGHFVKGTTPANKIVLPEEELRSLYETKSAKMISEHFHVCRQTVIRNLRECGLTIQRPGAPEKMPDYWKEALRKPKSKPHWSKGKTKETSASLMATSIALSGSNNIRWKPEIHIGEMVECACGCGQMRPKYDKKGRRRYFIAGHSKKGQFKNGFEPWNKQKSWPAISVEEKKSLQIKEKDVREKQMIELRSQGLSYKKIAIAVGLSVSSVRRHLDDKAKENGREYARKYYDEHKDKQLEYKKEYGLTHKAESAARSSKRRAIKKTAMAGINEEQADNIKEIYRRAQGKRDVRCYLCGKIIPVGHRHVDHIIPLSRGGKHTPSNLAIACDVCNEKKSCKMPEEIGILL